MGSEGGRGADWSPGWWEELYIHDTRRDGLDQNNPDHHKDHTVQQHQHREPLQILLDHRSTPRLLLQLVACHAESFQSVSSAF